jgi:hypothetical protein
VAHVVAVGPRHAERVGAAPLQRRQPAPAGREPRCVGLITVRIPERDPASVGCPRRRRAGRLQSERVLARPVPARRDGGIGEGGGRERASVGRTRLHREQPLPERKAGSRLQGRGWGWRDLRARQANTGEADGSMPSREDVLRPTHGRLQRHRRL